MSKRIAILSKYPPLEGGIAAKTYWMARGLADIGHEVHVIADRIDAGGEYRIPDSQNPAPDITNLNIHRPKNDIPWHLPNDQERALALLNITIEVIQEYDIQILDTGYLVPYGIIGHQAKLSTGVRHVMRHGGSDIEKFLKQGILSTVLAEAIGGADVIITEERHLQLFEMKTSKVVCHPPYIPDETEFMPSDNNRPQKRLAAIGKINYYWQHKGLGDIAKIMLQLAEEYEPQIIGQGTGLDDFRNTLGPDIVSKFKWRSFVPPWKMPGLLNELDAIFVFESALPHPVFSNLALEAMYSGVGIVTDRKDFADTYRDVLIPDKNLILVVSPADPSSAMQMIEKWVMMHAQAGTSSHRVVSHRKYLSANEVIYSDLLES